MRKLFKRILILTTIFAIAGLVFVAGHKPKTAQAYTNGSLVKAINDPNVYFIQSGTKGELKVLIRSISVFNSCGYSWANVQNVANINYLPRTANLIKKADNPDVYRLEKNFKRKFRSAAVLDSYNLHWEDIATVCPAVLNSYSTAPLFNNSSTGLFKVGSDFMRHWYPNMATFYKDGMSTKDIIDVNDSEIYSYDVSTSIPAIATTAWNYTNSQYKFEFGYNPTWSVSPINTGLWYDPYNPYVLVWAGTVSDSPCTDSGCPVRPGDREELTKGDTSAGAPPLNPWFKMLRVHGTTWVSVQMTDITKVCSSKSACEQYLSSIPFEQKTKMNDESAYETYNQFIDLISSFRFTN